MTETNSVTTPKIEGGYPRQKVVTPRVGGYGPAPTDAVTVVTPVTKQSAVEAKGNHLTTVTTYSDNIHTRICSSEVLPPGGDAVTPIPAPLLRIRRMIQAGDLDQASAAARDLAPIADHHDAGTLAALWGLCGIGAGPAALAVLDGHAARVGWALGGDMENAA